jgi:DNA-directed RNA polymerase subunit beta'
VAARRQTNSRCLFNEALPLDYRFVNAGVTKELGQIVNDLAERY